MKTLRLSSNPRPNALDYLGAKGIEQWESERGVRIELSVARPRAFAKRKAGAYRKEFGIRKPAPKAVKVSENIREAAGVAA